MSLQVNATYVLATPLFCSGADQSQAELRLTSFKGVLRYWWRALAWSKFHGDLRVIHEEERRLFGGPGSEGCSKVTMRLTVERPGETLRPGEPLNKIPSSTTHLPGAYYLGYGLMDTVGKEAGCLRRGALAPPLRFTVEMRIAKGVGQSSLSILLDALKAVGTIGGMGARSRRGYGSLILTRLTMNDGDGESGDARNVWKEPTSLDELLQAIADLPVTVASQELPEYTALSARSRSVLITSSLREPLELLDLIGREMMRYRSWGRNGKVLGKPSERRFKDDHDLMLELKTPVTSYPRRIGFGLPHNYFFGSLLQTHGKKGATRSVKPAASGRGDELDRRASPLFIHIHVCGTQPIGVLTFLPAHFLPPGTGISVNGFTVPLKEEPDVYEAVEEFLNRLLSKSTDEKNRPAEKFTRAEEVAWV